MEFHENMLLMKSLPLEPVGGVLVVIPWVTSSSANTPTLKTPL